MEKSNVYFTNLRTKTLGDNLQKKLTRLIINGGIDQIDFKNKFVAIKIHFGEPGNLAYLRPNYAKTVVDIVKARDGKPFLTDCNTLYVGGRKNALDHIASAYENGFSPFSVGCHILIADGLKGTDEALIPINCEYVKEAKIGRAIMDADVVISLSHFKGHENAGFGGALKNIGMGCGSRAGKMEMHCDTKPVVDQNLCIGCGMCIRICAHDAPSIENKKCSIDQDKCVGCGRCIGVCPEDAITPTFGQSNAILNRKIAEYAYAVVKDRPAFHISLVIDVSPNCDCHAENDVPIVPDVGMFASFDPVALDKACVDAVNQQPIISGSWLAESDNCDHPDRFRGTHPSTDWRSCLEHAEKIGIGVMDYNLIEVK